MEVYSWEICRFVARLHSSRHEPFIWTNLHHQPQEWVNPGTSHQFSSYFRKPNHTGLSQTMDFGSVVHSRRDHDHQLQKLGLRQQARASELAEPRVARRWEEESRPWASLFFWRAVLFLAFQPGFVAFVALPCFTMFYLSIYLSIYLSNLT